MKNSKSKLVDVKNFGGKETIIKGMVNHYKAIIDMKSVLKIEAPRSHVSKNHKRICNIIFELAHNDEYLNVRNTYKGVAQIKKSIMPLILVVDNNQPQTYNMGKGLSQTRQKELYDEMEHIRRLNAMSKRILSIGKQHERKKNIEDPISNPVFFFRKAGDEKATKLLSLDNYKEKLDEINKEERNKMLLNEVIYNSLTPGGKKVINNLRPNSANTMKTNKDARKDGTSIILDAGTLIEKHMKLKNQEKVKDNSKNVGREIEKQNYKIIIKDKRSQSVKNSTSKKEKLLPFPLVDKSKSNFKDDFQMQIIRYIVQNRLYRDSDLNILLENLIKKNFGILEKFEIQEIFSKIKLELDS